MTDDERNVKVWYEPSVGVRFAARRCGVDSNGIAMVLLPPAYFIWRGCRQTHRGYKSVVPERLTPRAEHYPAVDE